MICSGSSPESEKIHWMLTGACSFTLLIHHATILKNWNGKTYVRALVRYVSSVSITVRPSQNSNLATPMNKSISVKKIFMMMTKNGEDAVANRIQQRFFCIFLDVTEDDLFDNRIKVDLNFYMPSGSYATMLVKQLMDYIAQ